VTDILTRRGSSPTPPPEADVEGLDATGVLRLALDAIGPDRLALSASFGPEDIVILDLMAGLTDRPRVFTLDTGRLPEETYELMGIVRDLFGVEIEAYVPDARAVEAMVRTKGPNLFYESVENRLECCRIRKVEPLKRALATVDGWVTGLRRDQIATRASTAKIAIDADHGGIWKIAPLADWSEAQVWARIRERDLPYNALHDRGYPSIGCAPCTRPVGPGEDARAGRWWWEEPDHRECGLHVTWTPEQVSSPLRIVGGPADQPSGRPEA
jgi:phosphoadenosine phosphosulfate reductase